MKFFFDNLDSLLHFWRIYGLKINLCECGVNYMTKATGYNVSFFVLGFVRYLELKVCINLHNPEKAYGKN